MADPPEHDINSMEEKNEETRDLLLSNGDENQPLSTNTSGLNGAARSTKTPPRVAFLQPDRLRPPDTSSMHAQPDIDINDTGLIEDDLEAALLPNHHGDSTNTIVATPTERWLLFFHPHDRVKVRQFIRKMGNYLAVSTLFCMLVIVPIVLYQQLKIRRKVDDAATNSAAVLVVGTLVLSIRLVYLHLTHWYMPQVQKYVVRILWMVPIYAIQSYLSLRFHNERVYCAAFRDFYEAFVIASFVYYLMELLGGQESLAQLLRDKDPSYGRHGFPLQLILEDWKMGEDFMVNCKHGALQYVIFKTISTVLITVCELAGVYGEGKFEWFKAYPYLCFFQNLSVMFALYCLVKFYHAVNEELREPVNWQPLGKFLCIKGVVFFTWWQGVLIYYLKDHHVITDMGPDWKAEDVANALIDYCIVVEMVGFAIAHSFTFTYLEYLPGRIPPPGAAIEHVDSGTSNYHPPATLNQPMRFKDAFWTSAVPRETIQDIQELRNNIDPRRRQRRRVLSLQDLSTNEDKELEHAAVLDRAETTHG